jgi:hypothetical protein
VSRKINWQKEPFLSHNVNLERINTGREKDLSEMIPEKERKRLIFG